MEKYSEEWLSKHCPQRQGQIITCRDCEHLSPCFLDINSFLKEYEKCKPCANCGMPSNGHHAIYCNGDSKFYCCDCITDEIKKSHGNDRAVE